MLNKTQLRKVWDSRSFWGACFGWRKGMPLFAPILCPHVLPLPLPFLNPFSTRGADDEDFAGWNIEHKGKGHSLALTPLSLQQLSQVHGFLSFVSVSKKVHNHLKRLCSIHLKYLYLFRTYYILLAGLRFTNVYINKWFASLDVYEPTSNSPWTHSGRVAGYARIRDFNRCVTVYRGHQSTGKSEKDTLPKHTATVIHPLSNKQFLLVLVPYNCIISSKGYQSIYSAI